uniref:SCAN box domain-containing protein n=1 Tax=Macrostomum lignano TaxID=282301 RepID=A0A1I8F8P2_9PLAT
KLASASGQRRQPPAGPSQRPSEAPEEGRLLSWPCARAELPDSALKLLRQALALSALGCEDTERNVESPLSAGETLLQMQERRRRATACFGGEGGDRGRTRRLEFSQLTWSANPAQRTHELLRLRRLPRFASRNLPSCLATSHLPAALLSFLTRRLEQADPLGSSWLSRLLLECFRQILETASSTSFGYGLPSSQSEFQIPARSQLD